MKHTLTIVVPSYNEENYIYNTLWMISRQSGVDGVRVIVADGGSTDNTIGMVSKASHDFTNLQIELMGGGKVAKGRNNGASVVDTPYILFMDADSILIETDILEKSIIEASQYDIVTCKQKSLSTSDKKSIIVWKLFNWIRKIMPHT